MSDEEQMARLQELMNERVEQQEQRQLNFDEINFGAVAIGQREEVVIIDLNNQVIIPNHQEEVMMISQEEENVIPLALQHDTGRNDRVHDGPVLLTNFQESPDLNRHDILHGFIDPIEQNQLDKEEQNRSKQGEMFIG